ASAVVGLTAEFVHFADVSAPLTDAQQNVLRQLLTYGPKIDGPKIDGSKVEAEISHEGQLFLAVPRLGTISPWASKATDIAKNTGLAQVRRIERGIAFYVTGAVTDADKAT